MGNLCPAVSLHVMDKQFLNDTAINGAAEPALDDPIAAAAPYAQCTVGSRLLRARRQQ